MYILSIDICNMLYILYIYTVIYVIYSVCVRPTHQMAKNECITLRVWGGA